ncbi:MAG: hypothetical protein RBS37_05940 [Bacteroidales bacterium]|jgi:hypothetical protein|nr:hypothetical protein [Bacteroidales bacterium]
MKKLQITFARALAITSPLLIAAIICSCSSSGASRSASSKSPLLEYRMASSSGYGYVQKTSTDQYMDIQGQSVSVLTNSLIGFTAKNAIAESGSVSFDIVIDTAGMSVNSMMDDSNTDFRLKGKEFRMSVEPNGKIISLGTASTIRFGDGLTSAGDLAAMFQEMFPVFARKEISPGDVWTSTDTSSVKTQVSDMVTITRGNNTFTGYATIGGRNCMQINSVIEGTRSVKANTQGMDVYMLIPFKGTETIWFDGNEGVLVKYESSVQGEGNVEITGMGMSVPMSIIIKGSLELK